MHATSQLAPSLTEPLTWAQICERHPDEWVCLVEIERACPDRMAIRSARVIGHGKTRRESLARIAAWWETYAAIGHLFTGKINAPVPRFPPIVMTDEIRELVRIRR